MLRTEDGVHTVMHGMLCSDTIVMGPRGSGVVARRLIQFYGNKSRGLAGERRCAADAPGSARRSTQYVASPMFG